MYAIIEESGGQRRVADGERVLIDLLQGGLVRAGDPVEFDKVLVVGDAGGSAKIGRPYVAGAKVSAEVVEPVVMGEKIYIHKFGEKKGYRRKTGHRQRYTSIKITSISA